MFYSNNAVIVIKNMVYCIIYKISDGVKNGFKRKST